MGQPFKGPVEEENFSKWIKNKTAKEQKDSKRE